MKAQKNWPESASFLVRWMEDNNLIEDVERIITKQGQTVKHITDYSGITSIFDFGDTEEPGYWIRKAFDYKKAYDSAKVTLDYRNFKKIN